MEKLKTISFVLALAAILGVAWGVPTATQAADQMFFLDLLITDEGARGLFPYELQVPFGNLNTVQAEGDVSALGVYIRELYSFFVASAAIIAVVSIMFAGLQRISSRGNPDAISDSTERISQAIFGLVIALLSYIILNTINPQLLRLDALQVEPEDYSHITSPAVAGHCDMSLEKGCGGALGVVGSGDSARECLGVNHVGNDYTKRSTTSEMCQIATLSNTGDMTARIVRNNYNEDDFINRLKRTGWGLGWFFDTYSILRCGNGESKNCNGEQSMLYACGQIYKPGWIDMMYIGTWCEEVEAKNGKTYVPSCIIDLANVRYAGSDGKTGPIQGVFCQPTDK